MTDEYYLENMNIPPAHMSRLDKQKWKQVQTRMEEYLDQERKKLDETLLRDQEQQLPNENAKEPGRLEPGRTKSTQTNAQQKDELTPLEKALIKRFNDT